MASLTVGRNSCIFFNIILLRCVLKHMRCFIYAEPFDLCSSALPQEMFTHNSRLHAALHRSGCLEGRHPPTHPPKSITALKRQILQDAEWEASH